MGPSNESLMGIYQATGDGRAFATLVKNCEAGVYSYALKVLGSREEAEEATQEVFLRVHEARMRYRADKAFFPWLMAITVNLCRDMLRRRRSRTTRDGVSLEMLLESSDPIECPPSQPLELRESLRAVDEGMDKLPLHYREVLLLHYTESLSPPQVAEVLGISRGAVETRLYRARQLLRRILQNGKDL